mgnify:CR=1 FL=1
MIVKIEGMKCIHCKNRVETALKEIGASNICVDLEKCEAQFDGVNYEVVKEKIEDLGFEVK